MTVQNIMWTYNLQEPFEKNLALERKLVIYEGNQWSFTFKLIESIDKLWYKKYVKHFITK